MSDDLDVLARHLVAMAELDDGILTDFIQHLVSATDGVLVGLDHRIKSVDSLKRKLADLLALDAELELNEAGERVYDVLRFTVIADVDQYMAVHEALLAELQRQGLTVVEVRNSWARRGYQGINVRLRAETNQRFEIQFHTRDSYAAAKATRGQYEEMRLAATSPARAGRAPGVHRAGVCGRSDSTWGGTLMTMSVVFCASSLGGPEPRVLARFVTDSRGLHSERFDRGEGRWVQDPRISGFLTGQDDWAERIAPAAARQLIESWGFGAGLLDAPMAEVAST